MNAARCVWILSIIICVARGHVGNDIGQNQKEQDTSADNSTESLSLVTAANREFAFRLYRSLAANPDSQGKNIFFSPVSVSVALAALAVGARGETHRQLFRGLVFNSTWLSQTDVDQAFQSLFEKTKKANEVTSEGTAVFMDNLFKPQPEFLDTLKKSYFADGFNVDFTKSSESVNTINKYVEEKTSGKIDKLVESLDPTTVMYLISYIYFKGKWETPFDPDLTKEDLFMVDEKTKIPVQMMNIEKRFETYRDQMFNTSVLHLPFNSSHSMLLLLPDDMAKLENAISAAHVTKWLKWKYSVYIPKFSIKASYSLKTVLTEMGMVDMFGDRADLSGIAGGQQLAVSEVVHQATLDVDEAGATAAAATGITITLHSYNYVPVLKFNRPFMVIITDHSSDNILLSSCQCRLVRGARAHEG
ncbi:Serine protease inhibitor A3M [Takifugu flavidus]|uniref:Thyroxine-binding globulin n=1 Tax=Takifugu flavidus TaxID=433684 RepID=A0A5C6MET6_9TELE|nr:Serine protease inhibitor A3M [Takifugu flavidus]